MGQSTDIHVPTTAKGLQMRAMGWRMMALAGLTLAAPALADVKAGVDAWARGDWAVAVGEWRAPAIAGDADAQFNLGQAYKLGRGVPLDLNQAETWYGRAAQQGHPEAEDNYGLLLYQNGKRAEAVQWLDRSATRDQSSAQFVLGTMLFNGDVLPKDWKRAYALMTRASWSGYAPARAALVDMDRYVQQSDKQAGLALARNFTPATATRPARVASVASVAPPASAPPREPVRETPPARVVAAPRPAPAREEVPAPAPAASAAVRDGGWRVQLGAFGDPANARRLWGQVSGKFAGRQPFYPKAGAITKLQVGPFASSAEASRACATIRPLTCVPAQK